ncbi:MAG: alpha/beta hydrolase [Candidatus Amesbacteria bacterium]|nr:alpha/beta hydrolase [Candidatus Amesbacteria bacterium]
MQKVISNQLVNYEVSGSGKQNLIILHGWGGNLTEWLPVAKILETRYKIWLLDFPGMGGSPKPPDSWGIYDYAKFVEDFIKSEKLKDITIIGHSFGGRVAIILGARSQELVSRLILVDAAGLRIKSLMANLFAIFAPLGRLFPQTIKNLFGSSDYRTAGNMRKIFVNVIRDDLRSEMFKIKIPTLIIWGEKDITLPLIQAKVIKEAISGSILRIVWGAKHWPHLEKPDDFMAIIDEVL